MYFQRFATGLRLACGIALVSGASAWADTVVVAAAANMAAPLQRIASAFQRDTGHDLLLTKGATGTLYAQIRNGAPFDVLVAADSDTPQRLEREKLAVAGTRQTYAIGRLVLWSAQKGLVDDQGAVLQQGRFAHLALANPQTAPYGAAALEVMQALGLRSRLEPRWVVGESVGQAWQFVASGNAELGFVALSQVMQDGQLRQGSAWQVPAQLHKPLRQDAVLLHRGRDSAAAKALLAYLKTEPSQAVLRSFGYEIPR